MAPYNGIERINWICSTLTLHGERVLSGWLLKNRRRYDEQYFDAFYDDLQNGEGIIEIKSYDSITDQTVTLDMRDNDVEHKLWNLEYQLSSCTWASDSLTLTIDKWGSIREETVEMTAIMDDDCDELTLVIEALDKRFGVDGWTNAGLECMSVPMDYSSSVVETTLEFYINEEA